MSSSEQKAVFFGGINNPFFCVHQVIDHNPAERIYLTYKTRMVSEARVRADAKIYHFLISWYSFWLIIFSIAQISGIIRFAFSDVLFAGCSVAVFGLSLFVYGEKFYERADQFRNCYLELQRLYSSDIVIQNKMKRYDDILLKYENQKDDHYDEMLFDTWLRGQKLRNSYGPISISFFSGIYIVIKRIFRLTFILSLTLTPLYFGYFLAEFDQVNEEKKIALILEHQQE